MTLPTPSELEFTPSSTVNFEVKRVQNGFTLAVRDDNKPGVPLGRTLMFVASDEDELTALLYRVSGALVNAVLQDQFLTMGGEET